MDGAQLELDHVVPLSSGGVDHPANLLTSCADCNRSKRDLMLSLAELQAIGKPFAVLACNKTFVT